MQTRPRNSKVKQPSRQQSKPLKEKSLAHSQQHNRHNTHTHPSYKNDSSKLPRPRCWALVGSRPPPDPIRDCPSPALPPADLPSYAGGPRPSPRRSKGARPGSNGRERSSGYLLQPRFFWRRRPRPSRPLGALLRPHGSPGPWPGPNAAPHSSGAQRIRGSPPAWRRENLPHAAPPGN